MASMDDVPELDILVDQKNYEKGLREILEVVRPAWKGDDIQFKYLAQGYVNHMLACYIDENNKDDWIVARIFGTDVDFGQQRNVEVKNSKLFAEQNIGPPVYCVFTNGLLFKFLKGKTFSWADLSPFRDIKLCKAVVRELAKVHCKKTYKEAIEKYKINKSKSINDVLDDLISKPWPTCIIDEKTTEWYNSKVPSSEKRQKEMKMLLDRLEGTVPKTLCHGDCNPTNIVYDEENDKATLVDYEGSGLNVPFMDIADFLQTAGCGFAPDPTDLQFSPEFRREVITEYLKELNKLDGGPEEVEERMLAKYEALVEITDISFNYFWHMMAVFMAMAPAKNGIDNSFLLQVGVQRLEYYKKNKERILAIKIPE